jgi:hypothetical protein
VVIAQHDGSLTRGQPFFETLLRRDPSGGTWLSALLAAAPHGDRLGEILDAPGWLQTQLAVPGADGRLGLFAYPAGASRQLLGWYIDHPERLVWPSAAAGASRETMLLRRALIEDQPPGAQARAQDRAHDLLARSSGLTTDWWRFEDLAELDCVLITERLVVTVLCPGAESLAPATPWYPPRSELVRNLEAARHLADGAKRFASLVLSDHPLGDAADAHLAASLADGAPHLSVAERNELHDAYLGNLTWTQAAEAVGVAPDELATPGGR